MNIILSLLITCMSFSVFGYKMPERITIVIDWFEVFGTAKITELQAMKYETFADKSLYVTERNGVYFTYTGHGTATYKYAFECRKNGILIGEIYAVPRFINDNNEPDSISFKMANNLLYTDNWHELYLDLMDTLKVKVNNISRLDIAIDGCNDIIKFLNAYEKQGAKNRKVTKVGKVKPNKLRFNDNELEYEAFTYGARCSERYMVVYHKSKELRRSEKPYIKDFWKANGFEDLENVIRIEIRFSNKWLAKVTNLTTDKLTKRENVAGLFKKGIEKYFEFRTFTGLVNKSQERNIDLIPFNLIGFTHLERSKLPLMEGRYKVKLQVHAQAMQLIRGLVEDQDKDAFIDSMKKTIELYDLHEWYEKKLPEWTTIYKTHRATGHIYELSFI